MVIKRNINNKIQKNYAIPVVDNLWVSSKRMNKDRKAFYGLHVEKFIDKDNALQNKTHKKIPLICFISPNDISSTVTRHLLKKESNDPVSVLNVVATRLRISKSINTEEVRRLKKKLRRHRKKLGLVSMNTNIITPDTILGNQIRLINFAYHNYKRMSRSQRKKANQKRREYKKCYREERIQSRKKALEKEFLKTLKVQTNNISLKDAKMHEREAALFLRTLKKIQLYYTNQEEHLDILFKVLGYQMK